MDLKSWQQAQTAVIGSLLIDPEHTAGMIFAQARAEHFSDAALRHVFEAARGLWAERKPVDPVTICAAAGGEYEKLLASCMETTPTKRRDLSRSDPGRGEAVRDPDGRHGDHQQQRSDRGRGGL